MKKQITFFFLLLLATLLHANNITITNISLTGQSTLAHRTYVQFDVSWENSWRTSSEPYNWDAAWVFVKYRVQAASGGDGLWKTASLNYWDNYAPTGSTIALGLLDPYLEFDFYTNPVVGVFIYRNSDGTGTNTFTRVKLLWNYGLNYKTGSTPIGDNDIIDVQVFASEMVYVPGGGFYVGSGGTESGAFYKYPTTTNPYQITNENAITVGTAADNLYYQNASGQSGDQSGPIPSGFPKGFKPFYCMKYEINQQDYVDFLNTLTMTQASNRYSGSSTGYRYGITVTDNVYSTILPYVACNFLSWADVAAYLDWSCLRPMTEFEFEKASRGTAPAIINEYAWGTNSVSGSAYTLSNSGATNEVVAANYGTLVGNASYDLTVAVINGPLRAGIFAGTGSNTGRMTAGSTYYGIMEMSGNLWERTITIGNSTGRLFTDIQGDGALDANGNSNTLLWPGSDATGAGFRGGSWVYNSTGLQVSDRISAAYTYANRENHYGCRGVRGGYFAVGQNYGGGIIFYVDASGQHGLIASTADLSDGAIWGCLDTEIITGTGIGDGQSNTETINASCPDPNIAAGLCDNSTENGYNDWFLPSLDELNQLFLQKVVVGGFIDGIYWTSSSWTYDMAAYQDFSNGIQAEDSRGFGYRVRAIRAF